MAVDVFSVPVFLICLRESLETAIIVSVLLAFLKQTLDGPNCDARIYKKLVRQVWLGVALGLLLCLIVGGALIGTFYTVGVNRWEASELNYEGAFALVASVIITVVGVALLRIGKMQDKWRAKIAAAVEGPIGGGGGVGKAQGMGGDVWRRLKRLAERYAMFVLPFITVLREGIEGIVFVAGVSFSAPATSVPLAVIVGLLVGIAAGYILYKGGSSARLQVFLIASTCLLYLVAAGLFSRAVWAFEQQKWNQVVGGDAAELGDGPGSYDIDKSVWHVNCCSPELNGGGGWGFFNAILGWTNSATYGSVISYNVYWIVVMSAFVVMRYKELKGHWPLMKARKVRTEEVVQETSNQRRGSDGTNGMETAGRTGVIRQRSVEA